MSNRGDIVFWSFAQCSIAGKLINWFSGDNIVHCGMIVDKNTVADFYDIRGGKLTAYDNLDNLEVLSVPCDGIKKEFAILEMLSLVEKCNYSISGVIIAWFAKTFRIKFKTEFNLGFHCSGSISYCYRTAGYDIVPDQNDIATTPQMLYSKLKELQQESTVG